MISRLKSKFFGGKNPIQRQPVRESLVAHKEGEIPHYADLMQYYLIWENYSSEFPVVVIDDWFDDEHKALGEVIDNLNFTDEDGEISNHGLHVGGIVSSDYTITKNVPLVAYKALYSKDGGTFDDVRDSIDYVAEVQEYKIINGSFGSSRGNAGVERAISELSKDPTVFFVFANGNDDDDTDFPSKLSAKYKNIISVAAGDIKEKGRAELSSFSDKDPTTIVAQGENVVSTILRVKLSNGEILERTVAWDGTSMAAPLVASIISLSKQVFEDAGLPEFNVYDFHHVAAMKGSCIDMDCKGVDKNTGYGFLLPVGFLENVEELRDNPELRPEIPQDHELASNHKRSFWNWFFAFLNPHN